MTIGCNMIRVNWDEVEAVKTKLFREGASENFELIVVIVYHNESKFEKISIKLIQLDKTLFTISEDKNVKAAYVYDITLKVPYLKCEAPDKVNVFETVSNLGHEGVLRDFNKMPEDEKAVWLEITLARIQHYLHYQ